mmetsp:Transcript_92404/g.238549  ORF Transcript_92404/g.238549 Transcript_92404/m.238549 type:complete len:224 (-) Transcript_92404:140-811(-)
MGQRGEVVRCAGSVVENHLLAALLQGSPHANKFPIVLRELGLHVEWPRGVDRERAAGAVGIPLVPSVLRAAAAIAVVVAILLRTHGRVALVRRRLEGVCVGLHDVNLWAPLPANHVGIAVVVASARARLPVHVDRRGRDKVERKVARAANFAEVHAEAEGLAQEPELRDVLGPQLPALVGDAREGVMFQRELIVHHAASRAGDEHGVHPADLDAVLVLARLRL